jgi:hypothetical protein
MTAGWAEISDCGTWRWALGRCWDPDLLNRDGPAPALGWVMLNPSTADARTSDPTVTKCVTISRAHGYGRLWIGNLHAYRATSPAALRAQLPGIRVGPDCDRWLRRLAAAADAVAVAWGDQGGQPWARDRRDHVLELLAQTGVPLLCLGLTASGEPRHPCRLANATPLVPWTGRGVT